MQELIERAKSELEQVHGHLRETNDLKQALGSARKATNYFFQIKNREMMTNSQRLAGLIQSGLAKKESIDNKGSVKEAFELNALMLAELDKLLKESE